MTTPSGDWYKNQYGASSGNVDGGDMTLPLFSTFSFESATSTPAPAPPTMIPADLGRTNSVILNPPYMSHHKCAKVFCIFMLFSTFFFIVVGFLSALFEITERPFEFALFFTLGTIFFYGALGFLGRIQARNSLNHTTPRLDDIPDLIKTMTSYEGQRSAAAVKHIYSLCDVGHKQNRVPMVCSGKWDVLTPLAQCLTKKTSSEDGRHLACLALNNLSIPDENKRVMALGPVAKDIIGGLCKIIDKKEEQTYLCCICMMNLSFLEDSITPMLQHSPVSKGCTPLAPLDNANSLIRILERLLVNPPTNPKLYSQSIRWACGLVKNLAKSKENSDLLGKTDIPKCVVDNLKNTSIPSNQWITNSIEDFSLFIVLNLSQWEGSKGALVNAGVVDIIKPIMSEGNFLQRLKATMACALLDANWTDFPDSGQPANKSVSELIDNIIEKENKDGEYAYGVFKLYTATKAFRNLCAAGSPFVTHSSLARCFQIVSNYVLAATGEANGCSGPNDEPNAMSAEYSVLAIEAMLPAILAQDDNCSSVQSEKAESDIVKMLTLYANLSATSLAAQTSARNTTEQIKHVSGHSKNILGTSFNLWAQYCKREGALVYPHSESNMWT
jgi:uncharacterized membrane protein